MNKEAIEHRERLKVLENTMGTTYYETGHLHLAISDAMEEYHQAKLKLLGIADVMLSLFSQFGWGIKTGKEQIYGSCADIYAEINGEDGKYFFIIDDGNCHNELADAVYHIYAYTLDGKIFEGRIGTPEDFIVVMRVLGFEKTN